MINADKNDGTTEISDCWFRLFMQMTFYVPYCMIFDFLILSTFFKI